MNYYEIRQLWVRPIDSVLGAQLCELLLYALSLSRLVSPPRVYVSLRRTSSPCNSYRDYGGRVKQYEGPYDFHSEEELPELERKLRDIKAGGGTKCTPGGGCLRLFVVLYAPIC